MRPTFACLIILFGLCDSGTAGEDESAPPPPKAVDPAISLDTIKGEPHFPFRCIAGKEKAAVVIFITVDCPIANQYSPEIERIRAEYEPKGARFTLVHVDPDVGKKTAATHAEEYGHQSVVLIDRKHQLVKATGATVTPEAFVIDAKGAIRYRGRINDQFAGYGDRRNKAKSHDLKNALEAVLAGEKVEISTTRALGCFIPEF